MNKTPRSDIFSDVKILKIRNKKSGANIFRIGRLQIKIERQVRGQTGDDGQLVTTLQFYRDFQQSAGFG